VEALDVELGGREILHEISFEVREGEIVALVGPNGSGKTTLLRTLLGLLPAKKGRVLLYGREVARLHPRDRARLAAWMPQQEDPASNLTVFDYVSLGRYPHQGPLAPAISHDRQVVWQALRQAQLLPFAGRGILELSGGERQRALYARALAQEAPLLVLDEPTSHLDIAHQLEVLQNLSRFRRSAPGRAVLVSLHDLNLACRFADRLVWLRGGRLVAAGPPADTVSPDRVRVVFGVDVDVERRNGHAYVFPPRDRWRFQAPSFAGPLVHVIAGGGTGQRLLKLLVEEGFRVTAGVLHLLDSDAILCEDLGVPTILEAPFSPLTERSREMLREALDHADAVVLTAFPVGAGNVGNLEELEAARTPGLRVFLMAGPSEQERDFAQGRGTALLRSLRSRGAEEVGSEVDLLGRLRSAGIRDARRVGLLPSLPRGSPGEGPPLHHPGHPADPPESGGARPCSEKDPPILQRQSRSDERGGRGG